MVKMIKDVGVCVCVFLTVFVFFFFPYLANGLFDMLLVLLCSLYSPILLSNLHDI